MTYTPSRLYYGNQRTASIQHTRLLRAANSNGSRSTALARAVSDGLEPGPFEPGEVHRPLLRSFGLSSVLIAIIVVDIVALTTITSMATRLITMASSG